MGRAGSGTTRKPKLTPEQQARRERYVRQKARREAVANSLGDVSDESERKHVEPEENPNQFRYAQLDEHYLTLNIQPLTIIEANGLNFHEGSALKYLMRWSHKGGIGDLVKARFYINRLIELNGGEREGDIITAPPVRRVE